MLSSVLICQASAEIPAVFGTLYHLVGEVVSHLTFTQCLLSRIFVFVGDFLSGALEIVSSMIKSFPGMWQMLNKYFINLILNLWILEGSSSKFFKPNSGTNGLWSVSMRMSFPRMKSLDFSHAQDVVSASFSI